MLLGMPIQALTADESMQLHAKYAQFSTKACHNTIFTITAVVLMTLSCIVIFSAGMCLNLPGVNVLRNVIYPGVIPGSIGIGLSIPFIIFTVKSSQEKKVLFQAWSDDLKPKLIDRKLETHTQQEIIDFCKTCVPEKLETEVKKFLLSKFKDFYPDKNDPNHKKIHTALDEAFKPKED